MHFIKAIALRPLINTSRTVFEMIERAKTPQKMPLQKGPTLHNGICKEFQNSATTVCGMAFDGGVTVPERKPNQ